MSANLDSGLDETKPLKNARHEAFAQAVADGNSEIAAYKKVYKAKPNVARANASRLLTNASVRARVRYLQRQNALIQALSREEKRQMLAEIARHAENIVMTKRGERRSPDYRARISAIQEDNRMTGEGEETLNVKGGAFILKWGKADNV